MRFLHSATLSLHEFSGGRENPIPPYAILSHTWGEGEVSFRDMQTTWSTSSARYKKIRGCCRVAATDGFEYVWIDTCCIDKTSSSELSEAINSMYRWYQDAEVCYVYLSDVSSSELFVTPDRISRSRWFTRGWTLQELIAPSVAIFFDSDWTEIGTKSSLEGLISQITGIQTEILEGGDLGSLSIAQRMSWAAKMETTRAEDIAYSLMGIFDVNMPMLYGEGEQAFVRLQEEIIKKSDDESIFAWESRSSGKDAGGLLASSPGDFLRSGNIVQGRVVIAKTPFSVTNRGIQLEIPLWFMESGTNKEFVAVLSCEYLGEPDKLFGICLSQVSDTEFKRHRSIRLKKADRRQLATGTRSIYIRQGRALLQGMPLSYQQCFLNLDKSTRQSFSLEETFPDHLIRPNGEFNSMVSNYGRTIGVLRFEDHSGFQFVLVFGRKNKLLCVESVIAFSNETMEDVFWSFKTRLSNVQRRWSNESDRVVISRPSGGEIYISVRRQIKNGQKQLVIDLIGKDVGYGLESIDTSA